MLELFEQFATPILHLRKTAIEGTEAHLILSFENNILHDWNFKYLESFHGQLHVQQCA